MALPVWGEINSRIGKSINLISFDAHTDTWSSFNCYLHSMNQIAEDGLDNIYVRDLLKGLKYLAGDFDFEDVFCIAIENIKNSEQIKTAYDFKYLASYTIIHKLGETGYEEYDKRKGYNCKYFEYNKIDWDFLNETKDPIVVDFDLDFFNSREEITEELISKLKPILKRAKAITIAEEPYYFNKLKIQSDFTEKEALLILMELLKKAIED
jgi:hypothetical protein